MTHLNPIEVERELQSRVENDAQRKLRAILEYWGPNGERHFASVPGNNSGSCGDRLCVIDFTQRHLRLDWTVDRTIAPFLRIAAHEIGSEFARSVPDVSDSSFENARKMVLRAISLAGGSP